VAHGTETTSPPWRKHSSRQEAVHVVEVRKREKRLAARTPFSRTRWSVRLVPEQGTPHGVGDCASWRAVTNRRAAGVRCPADEAAAARCGAHGNAASRAGM